MTLGRAVATSTALPPLLTPITLENRGGTCGRKAPAWQAAAEARLGGSETPGRALLRARAHAVLREPGSPVTFIVFDGGLAENLGLSRGDHGLRAPEGRSPTRRSAALRRARKVVVISVNALRFAEVDWDCSAAPPDTGTLADQMWSIPVDRISLDAVEQVRDKLAACADASRAASGRPTWRCHPSTAIRN